MTVVCARTWAAASVRRPCRLCCAGDGTFISTEVRLAFRIRALARRNRSSRIVRHVARQCEKFLHGFYNEGFYDFDDNGEARVIEMVARARPDDPPVVMDVGANRGDWAKAVLARRPDAIIYCFEIVPAIADDLREAMADRPGVRVCDYGLSSTSAEKQVFWNQTSGTESSITPRLGDPLFAGSEVVPVTARVDTGDAVLGRLGISRVDLLKIDVEGHEIEVLIGFRGALASSALRPLVIQFEYGATWLPPRHTLHEAYALLRPFGYAIGRLYPEGADLKPYSFADDHFRMGNYIAVQEGSPLAAKLACAGS